MFNERAGRESRYLFSGKDAEIRDGDGNLLSTVDSWQVQVSFTNATYQPLGTALQAEFMTGYSVNITIVQAVVESDKFVLDVMDFFKIGRHAPMWTFSSVLKGYDGSEERLVFYDCVPTGSFDLHNITPGEIVRRNWNLHVNQPPEIQKLLSIPSAG